MQIEKRRYTAKLRGFGRSGLLSRFFVLLFSATIATLVPAVVLAQQPGGTAGLSQITPTGKNAIRPFRIHIPQEKLDDLRPFSTPRASQFPWPSVSFPGNNTKRRGAGPSGRIRN